jgi:hypothetical protein
MPGRLLVSNSTNLTALDGIQLNEDAQNTLEFTRP